MPRDGNAANGRGLTTQLALPLLEVDRAWIGREHHKLREGDPGTLSQVGGRLERLRTVARQSENERAEHMNAVRLERLQALDERFTRQIESLVHVLQPLRCDRLHADERSADSGAHHGLQERRIFCGFHRDLGEEQHVVGEPGQSVHQGEALGASGFERAQVRRVAPARGLGQVGKRHGIKVIVSERDESKPSSS